MPQEMRTCSLTPYPIDPPPPKPVWYLPPKFPMGNDAPPCRRSTARPSQLGIGRLAAWAWSGAVAAATAARATNNESVARGRMGSFLPICLYGTTSKSARSLARLDDRKAPWSTSGTKPPRGSPMAQPLSPSEQTDTEEVPIPLHEAYTTCEAIVRSHYENFPVASRFLTPARRYSLAAIYAFARRADDVADAAAPPRERLEAIDQIEIALHRALDGAPNGPIFVALTDSVERFRLPVEPLLDLLSAFRQDARNE